MAWFGHSLQGTLADLIEQLIQKSKRKVADGMEGYIADFTVRQFKKLHYSICDETPEKFVQDFVAAWNKVMNLDRVN